MGDPVVHVAVAVMRDAAGRVLVPDHLRSFAGLKNKTIIAGVASRVEIWEENAWKKYTASIERDADAFAEKLGDAK